MRIYFGIHKTILFTCIGIIIAIFSATWLVKRPPTKCRDKVALIEVGDRLDCPVDSTIHLHTITSNNDTLITCQCK